MLNNRNTDKVVFVDRGVYDIACKDGKVHLLLAMCREQGGVTQDEINSKFSLMTQGYIKELNQALSKVLKLGDVYSDCGGYALAVSSGPSNYNLTDDDMRSVKHLVKSTLLGEEGEWYYRDEETLYYDIVPVDNGSDICFLVVIDKQFFKNLVKSKQSLIDFLLDFLSRQYKAKQCTYSAMRLYLSCKVSDSYFEAIKLRCEL